MLRPRSNGHKHDPFAHSLGHRKGRPPAVMPPKPPEEKSYKPEHNMRCTVCGTKYSVLDSKCCPNC